MKHAALLLMLFVTGFTFGQSKPDCIRIKRSAESALASGDLRDALVKLRALKVCDPSLSAYVDNKIIAVYDNINRQKETAVAAQRKADSAAVSERKARKDAEEQTKIAEARLRTMVSRKLASTGLAAQSRTIPEWHLSLLLGMEALQLSPSTEADQVLRNAMDHLPVLLKDVSAAGATKIIPAPQGKYFAAVGDSGIKVWETKTGEELLQVRGNNILFSADGNILLTGADDHKARIIQLPGGKVLDSLVHQQSDVQLLAVNDDLHFLATLNHVKDRSEILIWDLHSRKIIQRLLPSERTGKNYGSRFRRMGDQQVLITGLDTSEIWQIGAGKPAIPEKRPGRLTEDGNYMFGRASADQGFSLFSFVDNKLLFTVNMDVKRFRVSNGGTYLMVSNLQRFQIWHIKWKSKLYEKLNTEAFSADEAIFSDNDKYFSFTSSPSVWDVNTGNKITTNFWSETTATVPIGDNGAEQQLPIHELERKYPAYAALFSPTGDTMYTVTDSGALQQWLIPPGNAAAATVMPTLITDLCSAADHTQYVAYFYGILRWRKDRGIDTIRHIKRTPDVMALHEKAGLLVYGGNALELVPEGIGVRTISLSNGDTGFIPLVATIKTIDIDPSGKYLLAGTEINVSQKKNEDIGLWVINVANKTKKKIDSSRQTFYKAFFWKSANKVLFAGEKGVMLKDLTNNKVLFSELHSNTDVLAIDKAYKQIAMGTKERVSVYTMNEKDKASAPITRHFDGEVVSTDFSASGEHLLIGLETMNNKGAIVIWDLKRNAIILQIATLKPVIKAVFDRAAPGKIISAEDFQVKVYEWKPADLMKQAARRTLRPLTKEEWNTYVGNEFPFHMKK